MKKRISLLLLPFITIVYAVPLIMSQQLLDTGIVAYAAQPDGFSPDGGFTPDMIVTKGTPDPNPSDAGGDAGGGSDDECKDGIKLNTDVPFIGKCIKKDDANNAFPTLIGGLSKMVVTAILIVSFMFIIIGGVQWTSGNPGDGKKKIIKVAIGLAILGASGAILQLINPNFFK